MTPRRLPLAVLALLAGCGTPGRNVPVDVPAAVVPTPSERVAEEVGRLLSSDPRESADAERRLLLLDEKGRVALRLHADTIPKERDPRWWNVLHENHMLPELTPEERLGFLLWKSRRPEPTQAMKAQNGLLELAHEEPDLLIERLRAAAAAPPGDPRQAEVEPLGIALAVARVDRAVPALVEVYRAARTLEVRRAAAEALALLAGEERRPRAQGSPTELARDADAITTWYRTHGGSRG